MHPFIWWFLFTIAAIWAQSFLPGVDFLAPAIIVCLQLERPKQALWLTAAFIVLQEGMGTLAFGAGILWYGVLIILYFIGRWLFESKNLLFVFFIGVSLGAWHFALVRLMGKLESRPLDMTPLAWESMMQAAIFTLEWGLIYSAYKKVLPDERTL
jgi:hypothetical protein